MSRRRGKRTTLICLAVAVGILASWAVVSRERIQEVWHVWHLSSSDVEVHQSAIEGLAECGGDLCVPKLLELLEQKALTAEVIPCLGQVGVRASPGKREAIVQGLALYVHVGTGVEPQLSALKNIARSSKDSHSVLLRLLAEDDTTPASWLASQALAAGATTFASDVGALLEQAPLRNVRRFFQDIVTPTLQLWVFNAAFAALPLPAQALPVAKHLLQRHPDEKVRALALSFQLVVQEAEPSRQTWNHTVLAETWTTDPSAIVKTAAARLAGFLGHAPDTLDLPALLISETDSQLLTEVIQARTLWTTTVPFHTLKLWDGFLCDWIPRKGRPRRGLQVWESREIAHLEQLLETRKEPALRDAASLALASRYRQPDLRVSRSSLEAPGLKVHEWGVWLDDQGICVLAEKVLSDLPSFVHRSRVSADTLWDARTASEELLIPFVLKPVVFFHAPQPLALYVSAGFHEGRPWTYYPQATDCTLTRTDAALQSPVLRPTSSSTQGSTDSATPVGPGKASLEKLCLQETDDSPIRVVSRDGFRPPWLQEKASESPGNSRAASPTDAGNEMYDFVPWVTQHHRQMSGASPRLVKFRAEVLASVNLEWCGLRVGYDPALEGTVPEAPPDHWWSLLREVPASPVAIRGEQENFLFYDGSVNLPAPVGVSWSDASREELALRLIPFEVFPQHHPGNGYGSWLPQKSEKRPLPAVLVVRVNDEGEVRGRVIENLLPSAEELIHVPVKGLPLEGRQLEDRLLAVLIGLGLTRPEAMSLIETWRPEFFDTSGVRVLTVLPQWMYDAVLPLKIVPRPEEIARAGIVWTECRDSVVGAERVRVATPARRPTRWTLPDTEVSLPSAPWSPEPPGKLESNGEDLFAPLDGEPGPVSACGEARKLAFSTRQGSTYRVLLVDLDQETLQLVDRIDGVNEMEYSNVCLAANGSVLTFGFRMGGTPCGRLVDLETRRVTDLGNHWPLDVAAEGDRLLCTQGPWAGQGRRLSILERSSGKSRTILQNDGAGILVRDAALSGDGTKVAFTTRVQNNHDVFLVDLEKDTIRNVSLLESEEWEPSLSHDGNRVLFRSDRELGRDTYLRGMYLAELEAALLLRITTRMGPHTTPVLLPGACFVFLQHDEDGSSIIDIDTGKRHSVAGKNASSLVIDDKGSRAVIIREGDGRVTFHIQSLVGTSDDE